MRNLLFTLGRELSSEQQDAVIGQVSAVPGVRSLGPLNPAATSAAARRFCKAEVEDAAPIEEMVARIQNIPGVMSAGAAAQRQLIAPVQPTPPTPR